jgi:hypothetical protein
MIPIGFLIRKTDLQSSPGAGHIVIFVTVMIVVKRKTGVIVTAVIVVKRKTRIYVTPTSDVQKPFPSLARTLAPWIRSAGRMDPV